MCMFTYNLVTGRNICLRSLGGRIEFSIAWHTPPTISADVVLRISWHERNHMCTGGRKYNERSCAVVCQGRKGSGTADARVGQPEIGNAVHVQCIGQMYNKNVG